MKKAKRVRARGAAPAATTTSSRRAKAGRATVAKTAAGGKRPPAASASPAPVRIARVAKGKKPQYFSDPAIDKLLWMTLTLMEELSVTRDRLDAVETLLEQRRVLKGAEVDAYRPDARASERRNRRRAEYVDRVLRAAQAELEELTGRDMPKSEAEVVAAVEA